MTRAERFWSKVEKSDGCWLWTASRTRDGYGRFWLDGRMVRAHRFSYEMYVPIPEGLQLDHLCQNRACVKPVHLEPVTNAENTRRGETGKKNNHAAAKTHCPQGHEYTDENTYRHADGKRVCRTCKVARSKRYREANRRKRNGS